MEKELHQVKYFYVAFFMVCVFTLAGCRSDRLNPPKNTSEKAHSQDTPFVFFGERGLPGDAGEDGEIASNADLFADFDGDGVADIAEIFANTDYLSEKFYPRDKNKNGIYDIYEGSKGQKGPAGKSGVVIYPESNEVPGEKTNGSALPDEYESKLTAAKCKNFEDNGTEALVVSDFNGARDNFLRNYLGNCQSQGSIAPLIILQTLKLIEAPEIIYLLDKMGEVSPLLNNEIFGEKGFFKKISSTSKDFSFIPFYKEGFNGYSFLMQFLECGFTLPLGAKSLKNLLNDIDYIIKLLEAQDITKTFLFEFKRSSYFGNTDLFLNYTDFKFLKASLHLLKLLIYFINSYENNIDYRVLAETDILTNKTLRLEKWSRFVGKLNEKFLKLNKQHYFSLMKIEIKSFLSLLAESMDSMSNTSTKGFLKLDDASGLTETSRLNIKTFATELLQSVNNGETTLSNFNTEFKVNLKLLFSNPPDGGLLEYDPFVVMTDDDLKITGIKTSQFFFKEFFAPYFKFSFKLRLKEEVWTDFKSSVKMTLEGYKNIINL